MAFTEAKDFHIDRSTFNDAQRDINYRIHNQHIHVQRGDLDIRSCIHSAMKGHIHTGAYYNSGARRDPSRCYPGTREAALKTISDWIGDPDSHCLWLHGPAGTGKSAIAHTVAERCRLGGTLGASYFFIRGSTDRPPPFFPTLAYQLMVAVPDMRDPLWAMLCEDPTVLDRSMSDQLDKLIVQSFRRLVGRPANVVIIIDGLDECDCDDGAAIQADIVRLILSLGEHSLPFRFIISSRPEPVIRRAFESSPRSSLTRLLLDKRLLPDPDIRHFLCKELGRIYEECVEDGMLVAPQTIWPSSTVIDQLVNKSSGHFIYASIVVKFVQEGRADPMERLDTVLQISNKFTRPGAFVRSVAFQELDQLYLHILRKAGDPEKLPRILRAVMYFGDRVSTDNLDIIFNCTRGVRFLLRDLHSIIEVTEQSIVRFWHASMSDFLMDPARSHEFHLDLGQFEADLAYEYTRLIMVCPPTDSKLDLEKPLTMAMTELADCLQVIGAPTHPGLLSATLEKLAVVIAQGSKSPLPLYFSRLDYLLRTLKKVPDSDRLREKIETILWQIEPQLTESSSRIFTLVRVLGICSVLCHLRLPYWRNMSTVEIGRFIGVSNGPEIIQQTLGLRMMEVRVISSTPMTEILQSLLGWLFAHHQPKGGSTPPAVRGKLHHLPQITVEKYTWEWALDTTASLSGWDSHNAIHHLDLIYCCLRVLFLGIDQPINHVPLGEKGLQFASQCIHSHFCPLDADRIDYMCWLSIVLRRVLDGINFASISRALPALSTKFYPRLFYLHQAFDRPQNGSRIVFDRNSSGWHYLRKTYSYLVQDPVVSRAVAVIYAMFRELPPKDIELLLGLAPGELFHSPAMQALFGVGVLQGDDDELKLSAQLPFFLMSGTVKFQHDVPNNYDINDYICNAHERLAIACMECIPSRTGPIERDDGEETGPRLYARVYWTGHLRHAKHSKRIFETLRRVVIHRDDIAPVIEWLEKGTSTPKDILRRWHAARFEHHTIDLWIPNPPAALFYRYTHIRKT